ncbi:MAG: hypothetical protein ABI999_00755 [Acidobacteriota bacterium]
MGETFFEKLKWAFIFWLARRLPDCKTITPKLGESLDRKQSRRARITIKLHLLTCEYCRRYLKQIAFLKEATHSHGERAPAIDAFSSLALSDESKARMKQAMSAAAGRTS